MHVFCKTDFAVVLLGIPDERGVFRFPNNGKQWPGIVFKPTPRLAINDQIVAAIAGFLKMDKIPSLELNPKYADQTKDGCTVYLATATSDDFKGDENWQSLPELLRGMDRNKKRLPFLRAWQVLTGSLELDTKAVENADLNKYLDS